MTDISLSTINSTFYHPDYERCGVILNTGKVIELKNVSNNPQMEFAIADLDLQIYLSQVIAFWHSHNEHTGGSPNLSVEDYTTFLKYPQHLHIIFCYDKYIIFAVKNNLVIRVDYANNIEFPSRFEKIISG